MTVESYAETFRQAGWDYLDVPADKVDSLAKVLHDAGTSFASTSEPAEGRRFYLSEASVKVLNDLAADREVADVPFVAIGAGEKAPWQDLDLNCPTCGAGPLELTETVGSSIVLRYITHCGQSWLRGPIS